MANYMKLAIVLNFLVTFLLLIAVARYTASDSGWLGPLLGAVLSSLYAAACTVERLWFLEHRFWYVVSIALTAMAAFGFGTGALRRGGMYCLLRLALDALAGGATALTEILWAAVLCAGCLLICRSGEGLGRFVPVELQYGTHQLKLTALHDTGNTLRDPVTGKYVMVVGADVARELTGLTKEQLQQPVDALEAIPGLRLIPYRTVDQSGRFLLALQLKYTKIGKRKGSALVAFAPEVLDGNGTYQALIGGTV